MKISDLIENNAKSKHKTLCIIKAEEESIIEVVSRALKTNMCKFVLVGDECEIARLLRLKDIELDEVEIVNQVDDSLAVEYGVQLVQDGRADAIMKGNIETSTLLKNLFKKEYNFINGNLINYLAVFELERYNKLLFITDPAINIAPDLEQKKLMIENSVTILDKFGYEKPNIGILCAKENVSEKMQATVDARDLTEYFSKNKYFNVYGPLAFDNAICKEAAISKGITSEVAGNVDLLVCHNIEQANTLYKSLTYMAGAKNAGIVIGMKVPIVLTSRTDEVETKLASMALSLG